MLVATLVNVEVSNPGAGELIHLYILWHRLLLQAGKPVTRRVLHIHHSLSKLTLSLCDIKTWFLGFLLQVLDLLIELILNRIHL